MFHDNDNDNRRFVVLDREDLDAICDALSALSFALTREIPSERLRSAAMVDGIVQEISAKYDLPGEPTR